MTLRYVKPFDHFSIPLEDGSFAVGVLIKETPKVLNSCICAFFGNRYATLEELKNTNPAGLDVISILFVTGDLLQNRTWKKVFNKRFEIEPTFLPDYRYEQAGSYKGAVIEGSGIVREFLNAYHGLLAWDMMLDPEYFDKLLLRPSMKPDPENLLFEKK